MAFLPYESKAFTLDYPDAFGAFYSETSMGMKEMYDRIADQLATVCAMLGEYPAVRYRRYVCLCVCVCLPVCQCVRVCVWGGGVGCACVSSCQIVFKTYANCLSCLEAILELNFSSAEM